MATLACCLGRSRPIGKSFPASEVQRSNTVYPGILLCRTIATELDHWRPTSRERFYLVQTRTSSLRTCVSLSSSIQKPLLTSIIDLAEDVSFSCAFVLGLPTERLFEAHPLLRTRRQVSSKLVSCDEAGLFCTC